MPIIAKVLIAVLAAHYFLAIATVYILLRDRGVTRSIIAWNLVILLIPLLGPAAYWIARSVAKKKMRGAAENEARDGREQAKHD